MRKLWIAASCPGSWPFVSSARWSGRAKVGVRLAGVAGVGPCGVPGKGQKKKSIAICLRKPLREKILIYNF